MGRRTVSETVSRKQYFFKNIQRESVGKIDDQHLKKKLLKDHKAASKKLHDFFACLCYRIADEVSVLGSCFTGVFDSLIYTEASVECVVEQMKCLLTDT